MATATEDIAQTRPVPLIARPRARVEPVSPFVPWSVDDRGTIPALDEPEAPSLLVDLLRDPEAIVDRLLDPVQLQTTVLGALLAIVGAAAFFGGVVALARPGGDVLGSATLLALNSLLAVAAALGPIYATGLLIAARIPLARLTATLLASTATGALILAALAPVPLVLFKLDPMWAGPIAVMAAYGVAGLVSGARIRRLLYVMAAAVGSSLRAGTSGAAARPSQADEARIGVLARMALVFLAFTNALSIWAFRALL